MAYARPRPGDEKISFSIPLTLAEAKTISHALAWTKREAFKLGLLYSDAEYVALEQATTDLAIKFERVLREAS